MNLVRKGDVIKSLIELSRWRQQLRYATQKKRYDLALQAADNCFALLTKAVQALIQRRG